MRFTFYNVLNALLMAKHFLTWNIWKVIINLLDISFTERVTGSPTAQTLHVYQLITAFGE